MNASGEAGGGAPRPTGALVPPAEGLLAELRIAAGFLTILPVMPERPGSDDAVAQSFAWFPLIGFALGAALYAWDSLLGGIFGHVVTSVLTILTLTVVTGAVHLDGLADTADALGAGWDRERALAILRDSRIGTFGAAAVFFALALEVVALATMFGGRRCVALFVAVGLARWSMVVATRGLDYLRAEGAGSALLQRDPRQTQLLSGLTTLGALAPLASMRVVIAIIVAAAIAVALRGFFRRWLGGVTGDLIGACGQIVEVALLAVMSI
jgi:adenosylcobinamide-GDP ribazoletransferase